MEDQPDDVRRRAARARRMADATRDPKSAKNLGELAIELEGRARDMEARAFAAAAGVRLAEQRAAELGAETRQRLKQIRKTKEASG